MIADLVTGELYRQVLYQDASDVVLLADHGESHMSADQFSQVVTWPANAPGWTLMARYQVIRLEGEEQNTAAQIRAGELARYAARNGGQIHTHMIEDPQPTWRDRLFGLIGG